MATRVVDLGSVMGPAGPAGPQGPKGEQGLGRRVARLVVGNAAAGWTEADCDYLCPSKGSDNEAINAAIQALPSGGGEIVLLDGTYELTMAGSVMMDRDNVTLRGNGPATEVYHHYVGEPAVWVKGKGCTVRDIKVRVDHAEGIQAEGDNAAVLNCHIFCGDSSDGAVSVSGSGSRLLGNLCQGEQGVIDVRGSGHVVAGNITVRAISSTATNSAVANNVVIPWEEA